MEEHNTPYFRNLLKVNMSNLESQCTTWEKICADNEIPEEFLGEIRTTIGLARLLMKQKLKQFKGLIDDSEFGTGEKEITCSDLQGFWDMVYFEVEKLTKCFSRLDTCKNNDWQLMEENFVQKKVPVAKNISVAKKNDSSTSKSQHAIAAKQRLAEVKQKMLAQRKQQGKSIEIIESSKEGPKPAKTLKADVETFRETVPVVKNITVAEINESSTSKSQHAVAAKQRLAEVKQKMLAQHIQQEKTSVEIIESSKEGSKPAKTLKADKPVSKKKSKNIGVSEIKVPVGEYVNATDEPKQKAVQLKGHQISAQEKENSLPTDDTSNLKNVPASQTKPKVKSKAPKPGKKEEIKLQCVTRSAARRAMLASQNAM